MLPAALPVPVVPRRVFFVLPAVRLPAVDAGFALAGPTGFFAARPLVLAGFRDGISAALGLLLEGAAALPVADAAAGPAMARKRDNSAQQLADSIETRKLFKSMS